MSTALSIGGLAGQCGVSRDTVRFYEKKGLLAAARRTPAGYRVYGDDEVSRLRFIRRAQELGLTLDDIRELLRLQRLDTPGQCGRVAARLRARIETLDARIAQLRALRSQLARGLGRCERGAGTGRCPVVLDLAREGRERTRRKP